MNIQQFLISGDYTLTKHTYEYYILSLAHPTNQSHMIQHAGT